MYDLTETQEEWARLRRIREMGTADDRYILDRILDAVETDTEGFELDEDGE
jgi:hypothetical protein